MASEKSLAALEIVTPLNTEIRAAGAGTVVVSGEDAGYGRYLVIDHGRGLETLYGHTARTYVKKGHQVRAGQSSLLARLAGPAPHLHFEVRQDGQRVDPRTYLRQP
jgi:murein DD-endopeptidase MepM/ murein hydrolase activator NlpD